MTEHTAENAAGPTRFVCLNCGCQDWTCAGCGRLAEAGEMTAGLPGATSDAEVSASIIASLRARLDAVSDLAACLVGNEAAPLIHEALNGYVPTRVIPPGKGGAS